MSKYKVELKNIETITYIVEANGGNLAEAKAVKMYNENITPIKSYERKTSVCFLEASHDKNTLPVKDARVLARVDDYLYACLGCEYDCYIDIKEDLSLWEGYLECVWEWDWQDMTMYDIGMRLLRTIKYDDEEDEEVKALQKKLADATKKLYNDNCLSKDVYKEL